MKKVLLFCSFLFLPIGWAFPQVNQVKDKFGQTNYSDGGSGKKESYSNLFSFALNILWDEAKRRLNLGDIGVKKEEQADSTQAYLFNINSRRLNISAKIPKQQKK